MFTFDLFTPWIVLAITLALLLSIQRWIHRHLFGVGYLISREKHAATFFYYLLLLPGVALHEVSRYLVAGMFHVNPAAFMLFPEAQEDGSLEMGFIRLAIIKNPVYAALIGVAPLLTGMAVIVLISQNALDLPTFFARIQSGDIYEIGAALQDLVNRPDFLLWTYILFAVANAMMPNAEDRMGWWIIGAVGGGIILFLVVIGLHQIVVAWLAGPIAQALYSLSAVFGTVLFVDCVFAVIIWTIEAILSRVTGQKVQYEPAQTAMVAAPRKPTLTSVYQLNLPLPPMPGKVMPAPSSRIAPAPPSPAIAASTSPEPARPAIPAPQTAGSRPAITSGESPKPLEDKPKSPTLPAPAPPLSPAAKSPSAPGGSLPGTKTDTGTSAPAKPAAPGAPSGQPAKPFGSSFGKPAESTGSAPASPASQPSKPAGPFGKPAQQTGTSPQPASQPPKPSGSPFGKPAGAPSTPGSSTSTPGGQGNQPPKPSGSPFGKPAGAPGSPGNQPPKPFGSPFGKPASPAASKEDKPGESGSKPPVSGPPALSRPGGSPPVPAKPNVPAPAAPKSPTSSFGRSPFGTPPKSSKDDYIDADFVDDEDEEAEEPGFARGIDKGKPRDIEEDDGNPKYVDLDDSP